MSYYDMKTIFVDAINGLVKEDGTLFKAMKQMLDTYPNQKIVLAGANDEQFKKFNLDKSPYEAFTLKYDSEKTDVRYWRILLDDDPHGPTNWQAAKDEFAEYGDGLLSICALKEGEYEVFNT